jgi:uncharacterized membrane protein YoaK (UPF0700 family)
VSDASDGPAGPVDTDRARTLWFALLLTIANGFMDAHTYYVRGGVFANVQTGNVIFFAIDMSERKVHAALSHVWPILAFIVGIAIASHIKSGRTRKLVAHPLRWAMAVQVAALVAIGFVPVSVAHAYVTVPIAFLAAVQMGLFRNIGDLAYLPVATTGNLMRFVESAFDGFVDRSAASRRACGIYGTLIVGFAGGALIGAFASRAWSAHAVWLAAGLLAVTLVLFIADERYIR